MKYRCIIRQDAWKNYSFETEAATPEDAAALAKKAWENADPSIEEDGESAFDNAECDPEDCELVEPWSDARDNG